MCQIGTDYLSIDHALIPARIRREKVMIAKSSICRRRGHGLQKDHARSDVMLLLDASSGEAGRRYAPPVDSGNERANDVVRDASQIGPSADVAQGDSF
jgi:hypothetical protein